MQYAGLLTIAAHWMMPRHLLSTLSALVVSAISLTSLATTPSCAGKAAGPTRQQTGRSEPGGGEVVAGETGEQTPSRGSPVSSAGWSTYADPTQGFSIGYPKDFVVQSRDVSKLARVTPMLLASILFMNPTMAAGKLAGSEPPDLEVRVYRAEGAASLTSWLVSVGLASSDMVTAGQPFRNASVDGLEVCQSTMIAPGCSVYILRNGRAYQLTSISLEGETMIETFALPP